MSAQGAPREIVILQPQPNAAPRKASISRRLKLAIDLMVHDGMKRPEAAIKAGITDDAVRKALTRPDVCAYRLTQMGVVRTSAASRTIARAEKLADDSESDHVKLQANTWLAAIEGISAVQKSENTNIHKGLHPGLTVNFIQYAPPQADARLIDGQAHEVETRSIPNDLPRPVPHPSMGNAQRSSVDSHAPAEEGEGGK